MNVMRSLSITRSASDGSHFAMSTVFIGTTPGTVMPLSNPEMWASGAGMRIASSGVRPCTDAMSRALYASRPWVWITPFGGTARSRGEQHNRGQVGIGTDVVDGLARRRLAFDHQPRVHHAEDAFHVGWSGQVMHGRGDGADAPARSIQHDRVDDVGELPAHRVAAGDAFRPQAAGHGGHAFAEPGARPSVCVVDDEVVRARQPPRARDRWIRSACAFCSQTVRSLHATVAARRRSLRYTPCRSRSVSRSSAM